MDYKKLFTLQYLAKEYKRQFDNCKALIDPLTDKIETPYGLVYPSIRKGFKFDSKALSRALKEQKLADILACVKTWDNDALERLIGSKAFNKTVTREETISITCKPSNDFIAEMKSLQDQNFDLINKAS